ncbi:FAD-binding protein [Actinokineospora sp. UTMC 2448]|uniref:FAD-binding protein n=1 Tax=Actinokineospora sp. UTMC 2448 TaxID=2268449 RepID=UPI00220FAC7E|nr:FAD-binding protein [Actinokineospora sp. UTMC 2448]UVS80600.1 putative oxidoreductase ORF5 in fasciation locus [Actinokineospora sp. UTMC 2448]
MLSQNPEATPASCAEPRLLTAEDDLAAIADDFGHLVHHRPRAIAPITSTTDAATAIRYARRHNLPAVPRGTGHSTAGQSQARDGLILDMRPLNTIGEPQDMRITVGAGATWHDLTLATLRHGLAPPVLTDYIDITVGGTLSVGGISGTTHHHGLQTDNVHTLEVITPDGETTTCSRETRPDLFDAIRAGRGRNGVITHATLTLIPAHHRTRLHHAYYRDPHTFLQDQHDLMTSGTAHYIEGHAKPTPTGTWRYRIEAAYHHNPPTPPDDALLHTLDHDELDTTDITYWDFTNRLAEGERLLRAIGHWTAPHIWANHLLPHHQAAHIITTVMAELTTDDISESGTVIIYPFPTTKIHTPAFPLPAATDTTTLFAILRTIPDADPATIHTMTTANDSITQLVTELGGTLYLDSLDTTP